MKRGAFALSLLAALPALAALVVIQRHQVMVLALSFADPPALLEPADEGPEVRWLDDYFAVQPIDDRTYAIIEPRYAQQNVNYLIVGDERAVLFDAGPGLQDVRAAAESLTDRPITFVPSHFHYDHTGNSVTFDRVAVLDLPYLRERATDDRLTLTALEHLGAAEGFAAPTFEVAEWLLPGSAIELGGRSLEVLYTPGHTPDSISLFDANANQLFSGDFLYGAPLFAFVPGSSMGEYVQGAETVLSQVDSDTRIFGAHRAGPPGLPVLRRGDVEDLRGSLLAISAGELGGSGVYPVEYPVNDQVSILAEPSWLQSWSRRHPEAGEGDR